MQDDTNSALQVASRRIPWNKGKLTGAKPLLRQKNVWAIRTKLLKPANGRLSSDFVGKISRAWTGWLTTLEPNSEVPVLNLLFEFSEEFRRISAKTRCRDFSRQALIQRERQLLRPMAP